MDDFRDAAYNDDISQAVLIGAIYGVFIVFGQSWSEFLRSVSAVITPNHEDELMQNFIHALFTSFLSIATLFGLVKCYKCIGSMKKHITNKRKKVIVVVDKTKKRSKNHK